MAKKYLTKQDYNIVENKGKFETYRKNQKGFYNFIGHANTEIEAEEKIKSDMLVKH